MYIYIYHHPSQFAFAETCARTDVMISCKESDVVHYNLCKVSSLKLRPNAVCFTTHKNEWEIFSVLPIAFPLLMWRFRVDALFDVVHSAMGDRKVPRTEEASAALHMLGIPRWSYNTQKLFCIMLFLEMLVCFFVVVVDNIRHLEARFQFFASAWWFEMTENGCRLTRKLRKRAGTEPNTTIGQLVKTRMPVGCGTTDISDTKKAHAQPVAGKFDAHMHA